MAARMLPAPRTTYMNDPNAAVQNSRKLRIPIGDGSRPNRYRQLTSLGSMRPFLGRAFVMPDGSLGGASKGLIPINNQLGSLPIRTKTAALARRAETIRRELKRVRLRQNSRNVVVIPGWGGADYAQALRGKPTRPSGVRGALRNVRSAEGVKTLYYPQAVAPDFVSANIMAERASHEGQLIYTASDADPMYEKNASSDMRRALGEAAKGTTREAVATAQLQAASEGGAQVGQFFALAAVVAVAFFAFKGA